ncbi:MAG TPA: hypothetical protein VHT51_15560 [Micropepsaceae bacterium]|nr:hypothetical protein [Micropepsaceae bacterium]
MAQGLAQGDEDPSRYSARRVLAGGICSSKELATQAEGKIADYLIVRARQRLTEAPRRLRAFFDIRLDRHEYGWRGRCPFCRAKPRGDYAFFADGWHFACSICRAEGDTLAFVIAAGRSTLIKTVSGLTGVKIGADGGVAL